MNMTESMKDFTDVIVLPEDKSISNFDRIKYDSLNVVWLQNKNTRETELSVAAKRTINMQTCVPPKIYKSMDLTGGSCVGILEVA